MVTLRGGWGTREGDKETEEGEEEDKEEEDEEDEEDKEVEKDRVVKVFVFVINGSNSWRSFTFSSSNLSMCNAARVNSVLISSRSADVPARSFKLSVYMYHASWERERERSGEGKKKLFYHMKKWP